MKTRNNLLLGILSVAFLLVGCEKNELPTFSASDSFIAFTSTSASVAENDTTHFLKIEVLCSSLSGIDASVYFEITPRLAQVDSSVVKVEFPDTIQVIDSIGTKIVGGVEVPDTVYKDSAFVNTRDSVVYKITDKGAKEGVHFTYTTNCIANDSNYTDSTKLFFTKEQYSDTIYIKTIDNDVFAGDTYFTITLKNANGANLGTSSVCEVTVTDDEHPLAFMLGAYSGSANSYFNGATAWSFNITKDPDGDLHKVWLDPLVAKADGKPIYGIVNDEKTELKIPVRQDIASGYSDGHKVLLDGLRDISDDDVIPEGEFINATIAPDATITIADVFGAQYVEADGSSGGWYDILLNGAVLTKK
jgi:hypothetical protein